MSFTLKHEAPPQIYYDGIRLNLVEPEREILCRMMKGKMILRPEDKPKSLHVYISRIRAELKAVRAPIWINNIHGVGYELRGHVR